MGGDRARQGVGYYPPPQHQSGEPDARDHEQPARRFRRSGNQSIAYAWTQLESIAGFIDCDYWVGECLR